MPDNHIVLDALGVQVVMRSTDVGGVNTPHSIPQVGGAAVGPNNRMPVALPDSQRSASGAVLIGNNRSKLRDAFPTGGLDATLWELVATGAGMTVTTGNGATSAYLNIASGTTINSETIIRSLASFQLPVRLAAFVSASQRIVNQEFFIELIEVDAAGAPINVATSQPNAGLARNHAALKFDGTVATEARVSVRGGGAPEFQSAVSTIVTTVATGTGPNFVPAGFVEMQATGEHVSMFQAAIDATTAAGIARRVTQAAPDPEALYKLQIRARNLGTAPATSTDWRVHALRLFDYTRITTEVIGGPGHGGAAQGVPVNVAGGALGITGTATTQGPAAIDAAFGQPFGMGVRAANANPAAMSANGDVAGALATMIGALVMKPHALQEAAWNAVVAPTSATDVAIQTAAGVGLRRHIVGCVLFNSGAGPITVNLRDGTTTRLSFTLQANQSLPLDLAGLMLVTANTALNVNLSAAGTVSVTAWGYTAP